MSGDPLSKALPKAVDGAVAPLTQETAQLADNIAGPVTKGIGNTLSDAWALTFGRLGFLADKMRLRHEANMQKFRKELEAELDQIPDDKRTEPSFQLASSALSDSIYCVDVPELRHMFCNLLASAANTDKASAAHPSFSSIIRRMSAYDAQLFSALSKTDRFPIVEYHLVLPNGKAYLTRARNVIAVNDIVRTDLPETASSLDVMQSLGLIDIDYQNFISDESFYAPFKETEYYNSLCMLSKRQYGADYHIDIQKGSLTFTNLGRDFAAICL